ncbi:hypothetical protein [Pedobacter sp. MW01-1-1]|uniref:hypothetical protein n=1 Tax=Pedobacter sp. MW01-1-1 TaxID=3383027 RepID=UPI003FEEBBAF
MQFIVYSGYKLNKEYITSVFCINKTHPELHCDGQCFLARKLKDLDHKNEQTQDSLKRLAEVEAKFQILTLSPPIAYFNHETESGYLEKPVINLSIAIFHPPKLA